MILVQFEKHTYRKVELCSGRPALKCFSLGKFDVRWRQFVKQKLTEVAQRGKRLLEVKSILFLHGLRSSQWMRIQSSVSMKNGTFRATTRVRRT